MEKENAARFVVVLVLLRLWPSFFFSEMEQSRVAVGNIRLPLWGVSIILFSLEASPK